MKCLETSRLSGISRTLTKQNTVIGYIRFFYHLDQWSPISSSICRDFTRTSEIHFRFVSVILMQFILQHRCKGTPSVYVTRRLLLSKWPYISIKTIGRLLLPKMQFKWPLTKYLSVRYKDSKILFYSIYQNGLQTNAQGHSISVSTWFCSCIKVSFFDLLYLIYSSISFIARLVLPSSLYSKVVTLSDLCCTCAYGTND